MIRREKVNKKVDGQRKRKRSTEKEDTQGREEAKVRVLYWNVSGLKKKSKGNVGLEIVGLLVETWIRKVGGEYKSRYRTSISGNAKGQNEKRKKEEPQG
jgi:hypothetical protein